MALIRSLEPDKHAAHPPRTQVDCLYATVLADSGGKLLRLATLGSDQRKLHPKPSQIIELDERIAEKLLRLMLETFPNIAIPDKPC
jgi:hypothetical protein